MKESQCVNSCTRMHSSHQEGIFFSKQIILIIKMKGGNNENWEFFSITFAKFLP